MDAAQQLLDIFVKAGVLLAGVLYLERRLTKLETKVDEILSWKNRLTSGGYPPSGH